MRTIRISKIAAPVLALAVLCATACHEPEPPFHGEAITTDGAPEGEVQPAPELVGVNWNGEPFRLSDLEGRVAVLFFGYTFCPDVCPMTLAKMHRVEALLGEHAADVEVVFVSVDPGRDTVEKLADYVPAFDPSFYGVHLTSDQLDRLSDDFDVTVQYGQPKEGPGTDSYYYVDHTASYLVVDKGGDLVLRYPPTTTPEDLASDLERLVAREGHSERASSERASKDDGIEVMGDGGIEVMGDAGIEVVEPTASFPPGSGTGAVYLTVVDTGGAGDRLLGASTPAARMTSLHESVEREGVHRMTEPEGGFEVPPGGRLELSPGGRHIMLMGLSDDLLDTGAGAGTVPLTLRFERAGETVVQARIEPPGP